MSETDSFIEEVTEEVRRERLYGLARRYGWIAVLGVVAIVGGAAWNEVNRANSTQAAQDLGDGIIAALEESESGSRADALAQIAAAGDAQAVVELLRAAQLAEGGDTAAAVDALNAVAVDGDVSQAYRDIAGFKALTLQGDALNADEKRLTLDAMVNRGGAMRLLAEEQLALMDAKSGANDAALERLERIVADAEATAGLRRRASQLIVALGGEGA